jgi:hypothetical protein
MDSKESNIDMPGSLSWFARVDNGDGRFIVLIDWSRTFLREIKFRLAVLAAVTVAISSALVEVRATVY